MRRLIARVLPWLVTVAVLSVIAVYARPIPNCTSVYGVDDPDVCVYAGYAYKDGVQVG